MIFDKWSDFIVDDNFIKNTTNVKKAGNYYLHFKGYWFDPPRILKDFVKAMFEHPERYLSSISGEFGFVCVKDNGDFIAATDKLGAIKLYYSINPPIFSTNFWWVLSKLNLGEIELNSIGIKEMIFYHQPLFGQSIIKEHGVLTPGTYIIGNIFKGDIEFGTYYDFKFNEKIKDVKLATKLLDSAINRTIYEVYNHYKNATFGVGISGGLDSRIIPYYLTKYLPPNKVKGFIIGDPKPRKIFLSLDHSIAKSIAKYYGIELEFVNYNSEKIEEKALLDIYSNPLKTSNMLKATFYDKFDVLVTGAYGAIVGGHLISPESKESSEKELANKIHTVFSLLKVYEGLPKALISTIHTGLPPRIKSEDINEYLPLISRRDVSRIKDKILRFVMEEKAKGKNNYEIFMKYHLSLSNHSGAFESLSNRKPAFSIYFPLGLEWLQNITPELIMGRKVLKNLILLKMPELAKLQGQSTDIPIYYSHKQLSKTKETYLKVKSLLNVAVRDHALNYKRWVFSKYFLSFAKETLRRENPIFEEIFKSSGNEILDILVSDRRIYPWILENTIKVKLILDISYERKLDVFRRIARWPRNS